MYIKKTGSSSIKKSNMKSNSKLKDTVKKTVDISYKTVMMKTIDQT